MAFLANDRRKPVYTPRKSDIDALLERIEDAELRVQRKQREQQEQMRLAELERRCGTEDPDYE